jgi:hypothetical protein
MNGWTDRSPCGRLNDWSIVTRIASRTSPYRSLKSTLTVFTQPPHEGQASRFGNTRRKCAGLSRTCGCRNGRGGGLPPSSPIHSLRPRPSTHSSSPIHSLVLAHTLTRPRPSTHSSSPIHSLVLHLDPPPHRRLFTAIASHPRLGNSVAGPIPVTAPPPPPRGRCARDARAQRVMRAGRRARTTT